MSVKDPNQQNEINATVSISIMDDGKILAGSVTIDYQWLVTVHNAECILLKTIPISISPFSIAALCGTHVAVSDYTEDKVCVYDLQSRKETLNLDIPGAHAICYDRQSECMLISRFTKKDDYFGEPVNGSGVIEQYCSTTGQLVARLARELIHPRHMTFIDGNTLAISNRTTIKLCKITDTKLAQPEEVIGDSNLDREEDSPNCSDPACAIKVHRVAGGHRGCAHCHII